MIFGSIEVPLSFDILDALVMECLPGYAPGMVEFTREQITPATVIFWLRQDELGDLGQMRLRKVSKRSSEMSIVRPPRPPSRDPTPEELKAVAAMPGREERLREHAALAKKIRVETDERHRRQKEHLQRVIRAMFSRFELDLAWKKAMKGWARRRGPTVRTQIRGQVFKELKDKHPEWTQEKVAMEAQDILHESVTADTVRNTYRAMGLKWKRGNRVRW